MRKRHGQLIVLTVFGAAVAFARAAVADVTIERGSWSSPRSSPTARATRWCRSATPRIRIVLP